MESFSFLFGPSAEPAFLFYRLSGLRTGQLPGPNRFHWRAGRLAFSAQHIFGPPQQQNAVVPEASRWIEFWKICAEIDVWSWPAAPEDDIPDGFQCDFLLTLGFGSRLVVSKGRAPVCGYSQDFGSKLMRLHHALQAMAGWPPPGETSSIRRQRVESPLVRVLPKIRARRMHRAHGKAKAVLAGGPQDGQVFELDEEFPEITIVTTIPGQATQTSHYKYLSQECVGQVKSLQYEFVISK